MSFYLVCLVLTVRIPECLLGLASERDLLLLLVFEACFIYSELHCYLPVFWWWCTGLEG